VPLPTATGTRPLALSADRMPQAAHLQASSVHRRHACHQPCIHAPFSRTGRNAPVSTGKHCPPSSIVDMYVYSPETTPHPRIVWAQPPAERRRRHIRPHRQRQREHSPTARQPYSLSLPPCAGGWRLTSSMLRRANQRMRKKGREGRRAPWPRSSPPLSPPSSLAGGRA